MLSEVDRFYMTFNTGGLVSQWTKIPGYLSCQFDGVSCQFRYTKQEYEELISTQATTPITIGTYGLIYWLYRNKAYRTDVARLTPNQVYDLILAAHIERERSIQRHLERAQAIVAQAQDPTPRRESISVEVRNLVFQRDGGRCVMCNSTVELQFDHIIPVKLGGANTANNLQILCGTCNRKKGATLG